MQQVLSYIPFLACPVGMGLMMWVMMRGMGGNKKQDGPVAGQDQRAGWRGSDRAMYFTPEEERAVLEERQRRLDAQIKDLQEGEAQPSRN